jgi:hypothetical protein
MITADADDRRQARAGPTRLRLVSILAAHEGGEACVRHTRPQRDHDDGGSRRATVWPAHTIITINPVMGGKARPDFPPECPSGTFRTLLGEPPGRPETRL